MNKPAISAGRGGFSLVEVTLAVGLVAFVLITLLGLLPIGLGSLRDARSEASAARALAQLSSALRDAPEVTAGSGQFRAVDYPSLEWQRGGVLQDVQIGPLNEVGLPASPDEEEVVVARIRITPPADSWSSGVARVSLAWPSSATWNASESRWENASGSLITWIVLPAK